MAADPVVAGGEGPGVSLDAGDLASVVAVDVTDYAPGVG